MQRNEVELAQIFAWGEGLSLYGGSSIDFALIGGVWSADVSAQTKYLKISYGGRLVDESIKAFFSFLRDNSKLYLEGATGILIDLSRIYEVDASGLGAIIKCMKAADELVPTYFITSETIDTSWERIGLSSIEEIESKRYRDIEQALLTHLGYLLSAWE